MSSKILPGKPELVIGLIAKVGTDIESIVQTISSELGEYGYDSYVVSVTSSLSEPPLISKTTKSIKRDNFRNYVSSAMTMCNDLRKKLGNEIMAEMAIAQIDRQRAKLKKDSDKKNSARAFLIRQLKRPEEVAFLRQVYGDRFLLVSNYCPVQIRKDRLADQIAKSKSSIASAEFYDEAEALIKRDEDEVGNPSGQSVRDTFPLADVILNAKSKTLMEETVGHFLKAFFQNPRVSPTKDEYGAYMAASASLRSLDLSRQVGAAIFNPHFEVVALGCNEVPKFGGGTYLQDTVLDSHKDGRDAALGEDANSKIKLAMVRDAVAKISKVLGTKLNNADITKIVEKELYKGSKRLADLLIMDIGEFGRSVHAEMNAITDAARNHHSTRGATLYSTTFPCHNCAKHIVAAGILRVVYIQPYPKSKVDLLYPDSIKINPESKPTDKVAFEVHVGIAPNIFQRIFLKENKRKDDRGNTIKWSKSQALPIVNAKDVTYFAREKAALNQLSKKLKT